jgi:ferritin-like metal-binding protein YciE
MQDTRERLIRYIQDAHAAEVGIAETLESAIDRLDNQELRSAFQQHLIETRSQADRLEARLRDLGSETHDAKGFFNTMMSKVSELMNAAHDDYDKATQTAIKAFAIEHLEIGMYSSLAAFAEQCGDSATANLARQIRSEEEQTAQKLYPMIEECARITYSAAQRGAA